MKIGNLEITKYAALAPMAGVADRAFRELCASYGAAFTVSEMVSSKGITMGDKKSGELMFLSDIERPSAVQLFGCEPETMAKAAIEALKYSPDFIDINMGCPAPKVASTGSGSALMKNPRLAEDVVRAVVKAVEIPVTVKIRAGWDKENINACEVAKRCENAGAAAITVHGRTREQMYSPPVDIDIIRQVKESVSVPVIGNGDVEDGISAAKMLEETGCDMLMVGRGALGRPWVFYQINSYLKNGAVLPEPPVSERMRVMLKHVETICKYKGDYIGMREARKHAAWYTKGLRGAAQKRREIGELSSMEQLYSLAMDIVRENS